MLINNGNDTPLGLRQSALKGGVWVLFIRLVDRLFYIIRLIVLARLLSPNDFGLMGIAMLMLLILEAFTQTGFQTALIQKKDNTDLYLNSAWTVGVIRGIVLCTIMVLIAPLAGSFLNEVAAVPLIKVLGFSILLNAFTNIGIIYFQKDLDFKKQFYYQSFGSVFDFLVAIVFAITIRNAWALIFGYLTGSFVRLLTSYWIHPFRPKIDLDLKKAKELFNFGKWILGSSILGLLTSQGDSMFISKSLGAVKLGFYQMAYRISNMPATEISNVVSMVTFPTYSKLQQDMLKIKSAYFKVLELTSFLLLPLAGLIYVCSADFTRIFLGENWLQIVPLIKILSICGLIRSLCGTLGPVFTGVGRPKTVTKVQFIEFIVLIALVYPLSQKYGVVGTSFVVLIQRLVGFGLGIFYLLKLIKGGLLRFLRTLVFPALNTILMILAFSLMKNVLFSSIDLLKFILTVAFSVSVYILVSILYFKRHETNIFNELKTVLVNKS